MARAGAVKFDLPAVRRSIDAARILHQWRQGSAPDEAALADPGLRRRLVIQGLETAVAGAEFAKRGLTIEPTALRDALENAAAGKPVSAPADSGDPDTLDARLVARYHRPAAQVREVVVDVLRNGALAQALADAVPESEVEADWRAENTRLVLDVVQVPRVPSTTEIDRFVMSRGDEIDLHYDAHRGRYRTPERAVLHRIVVPTKAAASALRDTLLAGDIASDFAGMARQHSTDPTARNGGRLGPTSRERQPIGFSVEVGALTPVVPEGGGVAFYWVEQRLPASLRRADDPRVRREIAATRLRELDELTHAKSTAERVARALKRSPDGERLETLVREARLRRHKTQPFALTSARTIPGIGLAPELYEAVLKLRPDAAVTVPIAVRQHIVVARLVSRTTPGEWLEARAAYLPMWRKKRASGAIDGWLSQVLKGQPMWVDTDALAALTAEELTVAP